MTKEYFVHRIILKNPERGVGGDTMNPGAKLGSTIINSTCDTQRWSQGSSNPEPLTTCVPFLEQSEDWHAARVSLSSAKGRKAFAHQ